MSALRKSPEGFFVLYTALRPNHIRSMVTDSYTQSKPLNQIIAEGYGEVIPTLLRRQAAIADRYYLRRNAPHLADVLLSSDLYEIKSDADSVRLEIDYPNTIRFLDLKKTRKGKKKRYYTPIYNRPLFGHVYGRGYSLSAVVNLAIRQEFNRYIALFREFDNTTIEI